LTSLRHTHTHTHTPTHTHTQTHTHTDKHPHVLAKGISKTAVIVCICAYVLYVTVYVYIHIILPAIEPAAYHRNYAGHSIDKTRHRRQSWEVGGRDPPDFGQGGRGESRGRCRRGVVRDRGRVIEY